MSKVPKRGFVSTRSMSICNVFSLVDDLKLCKDLEKGKRIHLQAVETQYSSNINVVNALIRMYAKFGSMRDARRVFDTVQTPDVVTWTALLLGYAENGEGHRALKLFSKMKASRCIPDSAAYVAVIQACASIALNGDKMECLEMGRNIHSEVGSRMNHYVQTALIDMYTKCGSMVDARRVFERLKNRSIAPWTALLLGYVENGEAPSALELFSGLKNPGPTACIAALKACSSLAVEGDDQQKSDVLQRGREIHSRIDFPMENNIKSTLLDMYAKCGSMGEARDMFDSIDNPDVVSWNVLLLGYAYNGNELEALYLFGKMKASGCTPDSITYIAALKACASLAAKGDSSRKAECLELGKELHLQIGCHLSRKVQNTLIDMYAKCGSMVDARLIFDNIRNPNAVSWNALILGYADNGQNDTALDLFSRMEAEGHEANHVLKSRLGLPVNEDDLNSQD